MNPGSDDPGNEISPLQGSKEIVLINLAKVFLSLEQDLAKAKQLINAKSDKKYQFWLDNNLNGIHHNNIGNIDDRGKGRRKNIFMLR